MKYIAVKNEEAVTKTLTFPKGTVVYSSFVKLQEAVAKMYPGVDDDNFTVYHCKDEDTKFSFGKYHTMGNTTFYYGLPDDFNEEATKPVVKPKQSTSKQSKGVVKGFDELASLLPQEQ